MQDWVDRVARAQGEMLISTERDSVGLQWKRINQNDGKACSHRLRDMSCDVLKRATNALGAGLVGRSRTSASVRSVSASVSVSMSVSTAMSDGVREPLIGKQ